MTSWDFDGHPTRDFRLMTPDERMDKLSREAALVLELRASRSDLIGCEPFGEQLRTPLGSDSTAPTAGSF